jgi:excinuclease ABC subunit B
MNFKLTSEFEPTGDQPKAIAQLVKGLGEGEPAQVLLGVTGSGKTYSIANVVAQINRPTLVLSHNKTLAAQLYGEFKQFFPENAVEYFISYYDYYQPEAYIATTGTYIEKDLQINEEIDKLRLAATSALMSGRRDVLVVASVSCIYGMGNPDEFKRNLVRVGVGETISRNQLLHKFVSILYSRTETDFQRGTFRVKGDTVDLYVAYADFAYRIIFYGDEIESIHRIEPDTGKKISAESLITIFPATLFVTGRDTLNNAMHQIQDDLVAQIKYFSSEFRESEATRIQARTGLLLRHRKLFALLRSAQARPTPVLSARLFPRRLPDGY